MLPPFQNEPFTDFAQPGPRAEFQAALDGVGRLMGRSWPLVIAGERITSGKTFRSTNPARHADTIGTFASASTEHVDRAIDAAWEAQAGWGALPTLERAMVIARAGALMRRRKHELSAWMVLETGKPWAEADADTAEAIDFCEFYAREALRYDAEQPLTPQPFEAVQLRYVPLGVGVVIPPWNFPLAITTGMTTAAIVAGNAVVVKPSSDAPGIAHAMLGILEEAGVPPGVVNLVSGGGGDIGDHAVDHPRTRFVSFTGSKAVGIRVNERAARVQPGQRWLKRVVAEMGGKDAIVVDSDTDLDAASTAAVASAFGFSGQKCSACSRLIVVDDVYDQVLEQVVEDEGAAHG